MSRPHTVWQRKNSPWWYTTVNGKQERLAKDREEALTAMHALLAHGKKPEHVKGRPTFRKVADDFLESSRETNSQSAVDSHTRYLDSFCEFVKAKRAPDLRGEDVTKWLRTKPTWGPSTRSLAIQAVKAALNYAVKEGVLSVHPLIKVKQGAIGRRERILTPEERAIIRKRASGTFVDFLFALEQTGARPFSEIGRLEARMINWQDGTAELPEHKNSRHGKRRILYFTPEMMTLLRRLAAEHPDGLLFRNRFGNAWDRMAWQKWSKLFAAEGVKGVTAYALRHSYATDAIARGVPLPMLAELMGTSVKMLLANYSHVCQKKDALKEAAMRAVT